MVDNEKWTLTTVYGPQTEMEKISFMGEIRALKQTAHERWLLLGDFNLIYRASDKNNSNINRHLMNRFRICLEEIEMKPIHLHGCRYTWTSGALNPTQTKIDHIFTTKGWELFYPNCHLQAGGTSISDHCPLILACSPLQKRFKGFRFESCWLLSSDFKEVVSKCWTAPLSATKLEHYISSWLDFQKH
jgi:exonuclease III